MRAPPQLRPPTLALGPSFAAEPVVAATAARPAIDPRISARRIAVRRSEGRRRLRRLLWVGGAVAVVLAVIAATRTPLLDVDRIDVTGASRVSDDTVAEVLAAAGLSRGRPLTDVDLHAAAVALESLPEVEHARLQRRWPGTITINITERVPIGAVPVSGGTALVAADGVVVGVDTAGAPPSGVGLVVLAGPPDLVAGDRFADHGMLAVARALPEVLVARVARIVPGEGDGAVALELQDGGVVRLGAADQLGAKLVAAETVLAQVDTTCLATLDVRVPSAPTVTRRAGCR